MNISTNISTNFKNIQETQQNKEVSIEFQGFIESLEGDNSIPLLDKESEVDKSEDVSINYEVIKNILNLLKNIDTSELSSIKENISFDIDDLLSKKTENLNDLSDLQLEFINKLNKLFNENNTIESTFNNEAGIKEKSEILNLLNEIISRKGFDKNLFAKDLNNNLNTDRTSTNKEERNIYEEYNQLEVNTLLNKSSISKINTNLDNEDLEINVLEEILDNNKIGFVNNFVDINNSNEKSLEEKNINIIRKDFISEDIIKTVKYIKSNSLEEIKVKITPKDLGEMTIKFIKNPEETKLLITISKEDVFDLVNKHVQDISKHLSETNIKVKEIQVDIKNDNQRFFSDNLNQEFNRKNQENKKKKANHRVSKVDNIEYTNTKNAVEDNINILV